MAPAAATPDMFIRDGKGDTTLSQNGPLASGIPGSVAVYSYAAEHFGKKKLADLIEPAASLAEKGFPIDEKYAGKLKATAKELAMFPATAAIFLKRGRQPHTPPAKRCEQSDLANTYRSIAALGTHYFYQGEFADSVGKWMHDHGGIITAVDFAHYEMKLREPLVSHYRDYTIIGFPPPSSGGLHVAQILDMMQGFDLAKLNREQQINVTASAMELAFADRAYWLGDPDFVHVSEELAVGGSTCTSGRS